MNSQLARLHMLKASAGFDDDTYRDFLERETGRRSARHLTQAEAREVIGKLSALAKDSVSGAVAGLDSAIGRKLRALWIAAWNLGIVRDRSDRAMLSFLHRQTGVSHTRFLVDSRAGNSAIEGLKSWLARDGKVEWPSDTAGAKSNKRAVLNAQWMRLIELGGVKPYVSHMPLSDLDSYAYRVAGKQGWVYFTPADYDAVQAALGRRLRAWIERRPA